MKCVITFEIENETAEDRFKNATLIENLGLSLFEKLNGSGKAKVEIKIDDKVCYTEEIDE